MRICLIPTSLPTTLNARWRKTTPLDAGVFVLVKSFFFGLEILILTTSGLQIRWNIGRTVKL